MLFFQHRFLYVFLIFSDLFFMGKILSKIELINKNEVIFEVFDCQKWKKEEKLLDYYLVHG